MEFKDALKQARTEKGLSQKKASALCSISLRSWQEWEKGSVVPHRYMQTGALSELGRPDTPAQNPHTPPQPKDAESAQPKTNHAESASPALTKALADLAALRSRAPIPKPGGKLI